MLKYLRVCKVTQKCKKLSKSMQSCAKVCKVAQKYAKLRKSMQSCAKVCRVAQTSAKQCKVVWKCAKLDKSVQNMLNVKPKVCVLLAISIILIAHSGSFEGGRVKCFPRMGCNCQKLKKHYFSLLILAKINSLHRYFKSISKKTTIQNLVIDFYYFPLLQIAFFVPSFMVKNNSLLYDFHLNFSKNNHLTSLKIDMKHNHYYWS